MTDPLAFVIEDDEAQADLFFEALRKARFDVEIIYDGQIALSRLADATPSMVVLDINLPSVSGVDILEYIRADPRLVKTRVIVASANPQAAVYLRAQADLVLIKPVSYFQLRDLAARLRADDAPPTP
jgi:DNA-binding response OmpR family regulator